VSVGFAAEFGPQGREVPGTDADGLEVRGLDPQGFKAGFEGAGPGALGPRDPVLPRGALGSREFKAKFERASDDAKFFEQFATQARFGILAAFSGSAEAGEHTRGVLFVGRAALEQVASSRVAQDGAAPAWPVGGFGRRVGHSMDQDCCARIAACGTQSRLSGVLTATHGGLPCRFSHSPPKRI
jgi:hypothetical protein